MKAEVQHTETSRVIDYYFDEKLIDSKPVPKGDFLTDDDWIHEMVSQYTLTTKGLYCDIISNHSDMIHLTSIVQTATIEHLDFVVDAVITEKKDYFYATVTAPNTGDSLSVTVKASDYSEFLEKLRLLIDTLIGVSNEFTSNISELSNDQIKNRIKW